MTLKIYKKVLIVATTASMIEQFNEINIKLLQSIGFEVHVACNFDEGNTITASKIKNFKHMLKEKNIKYYNLPIKRSPFAYGMNIKSCMALMSLIKKYKYQIIHCQTPVGGVVARLAAFLTKNWHGKVVYTAHGFHFFRGAPLHNILIYKTVEYGLARITDCLVTINEEDYQAAKKFHLKKYGHVIKIPGIGIDVKKIQEVKYNMEIKKSLCIEHNQKVILSVGELNTNKNHEIVIRAIAKLKRTDITYVICGKGYLKKYLINLSKQLNIERQVVLLGYREDVIDIMAISDLFIHPSNREGLSVALMQAMAVGLPVICSNIRGNIDLIENNVNGILCNPDNVNEFYNAIKGLIDNDALKKEFSANNKTKIKCFDYNNVIDYLNMIYRGN